MNRLPAHRKAAELEPIIRGLQQQGVTSLVELAKALNQQGLSPTHRGGAEWTAVNVARMLARTVSCAKATATSAIIRRVAGTGSLRGLPRALPRKRLSVLPTSSFSPAVWWGFPLRTTEVGL